MNRLLRFTVCAGLLLAAAAPLARADLITGSVNWDRNLSTPRVYSNDPTATAANRTGVAFKDWSSWSFSPSLPASGRLGGELEIFNRLGHEQPAHFHDTPFTLTFAIHDGHVPGAITFSGVLNGTLRALPGGQEKSSMSIDWIGATTKSLDLNHHIYTLSISGFTRTGTLPDPDELGRIDVEIHVRHNPEPASLVLGLLALPALGLVWRGMKRTPPGVAAG
jgi:hypothetical protein